MKLFFSRDGLSRRDRFLQRVLLRVRPAFLGAALKRLLGIERIVVATRHGRFFIDPISNLGSTLTASGEYEPEMIRTLAYFLKPSGTFVDVGANEGYFSVIGYRAVGTSGKVIAVEPQSRLRHVLQENFRLNEMPGIQIAACAVSDVAGTANLHLSPDTNTGSTSLDQSTLYTLPTEQVPTMTLAQLLSEAKLETVDLVKMDIEGFEYEAILGSKEVFAAHRVKVLALELHPPQMAKRGLDHNAIAEFLGRCGYQRSPGFSNLVWVSPRV
jgi:FkbM family methyltransferase